MMCCLVIHYSKLLNKQFVTINKFQTLCSTNSYIDNKLPQIISSIAPNHQNRSVLDNNGHNNENSNKNRRFNEIGIEMIPKQLFKAIFGDHNCDKSANKVNLREIEKHLRSFQLKTSCNNNCDSNDINDLYVCKHMPSLYGDDISTHFETLGNKYCNQYKKLCFDIINAKPLDLPNEWVFSEGWSRYTIDSNGNYITEKVDYPLEDAIIFDVEVCMSDSNGQKPTLATALSHNAWYSWCSKRLIKFDEKFDEFKNSKLNSNTSLDDLIALEANHVNERLVIGHNVSFDRSYIKQQYAIECDKTRFIDTMSIHMCISGLTQHQRALSISNKFKSDSIPNEQISPDMWRGIGSLNNLIDVHKLYCNHSIINDHSKDMRNIFIKGNLKDVFNNFQQLMSYCAKDVLLTHEIFKNTFPLYLKRFPHPITLAGMLEMSTMYLPVNTNNWNRYITEAQSIYNEQEKELKLTLREIANEACSLLTHHQYNDDVWLWDLDWSTKSVAFKINKPEKIKKSFESKTSNSVNKVDDEFTKLNEEQYFLTNKLVNKMLSTTKQLKKVQPLLPGYPQWFIEFCTKPQTDILWEPGPNHLSTQMRTVSKLIRLMWNGYPLHYNDKYGWGYLVPNWSQITDDRVPGGVDHNKNIIYFPMKQYKMIIRETQSRKSNNLVGYEQLINDDLCYNCFEEPEFDSKLKFTPIKDVIEGCLFYKLPHKEGPDKRVGNPLSKDFLRKVEDGTLTAYKSDITNLVLQQGNKLSYWKNASKRINSQMVITCDDGINGAILPRVIVAGTVTRRAVEPTWLTASNAVEDRIGSELKSFIQCPADYCFVGADVDSQELWIASLLGDAHFSGVHGSTGIGWMTLQGNKAEGTDMHSKTAKSINITRNQAKVLNYARIYGSGEAFASRFLMQTDRNLTEKEAKEKAAKIFLETKGTRKKYIDSSYISHLNNNVEQEIKDEEKKKYKKYWFGGTESHMFNKLEEVASSQQPKTPFLGCSISRALEPRVVKTNYITSRINWVVQSSAVDFLHLMLISMKWLFEEYRIEGRFSISIHDELRYLVKNEHKYNAALALQLSNLLTRSFFSHKLGLQDLPLSVAFFSSVEIDKCLRKEVNLDCKTPSNPLGLKKGYRIDFGESLDIIQLIKKLDKIND